MAAAFDTHELINNRRQIRKIELSVEGDGAFAVVDIDTLWRDQQGMTIIGRAGSARSIRKLATNGS